MRPPHTHRVAARLSAASRCRRGRTTAVASPASVWLLSPQLRQSPAPPRATPPSEGFGPAIRQSGVCGLRSARPPTRVACEAARHTHGRYPGSVLPRHTFLVLAHCCVQPVMLKRRTPSLKSRRLVYASYRSVYTACVSQRCSPSVQPPRRQPPSAGVLFGSCARRAQKKFAPQRGGGPGVRFFCVALPRCLCTRTLGAVSTGRCNMRGPDAPCPCQAHPFAHV